MIAKNAVPLGTYRIGVFFTNDKDGYYTQTNQVLKFIPSKISVASFDGWLNDATLAKASPVSITNTPADMFIYDLDKLAVTESNSSECVRLSGYVFSTELFNQQPETISLIMDTADEIVEYPTTSFHNPGVPIYYKRADIGDPGFLGCIPINDLSKNESKIGLRIAYTKEDYFLWTSISLSKNQGKPYNHSEEIGKP